MSGSENMYDVIIVGAGPAGISTSLYTIRGNLKTLVIYKENSALENASKIENYYGFKNGVKGEELYRTGIEQAINLGVEVLEEEVTNIQIDFIELDKENINTKNNFIENDKKQIQQIFKVETLNNEFQTKAVVLATGNKKNKPNINKIDEYEGRGVSYCAVCDGFFYRNKDVVVIGNGDYAISETMNLQNVVRSTTILTNGQKIPEYRAENVNINDKEIKEIHRRK